MKLYNRQPIKTGCFHLVNAFAVHLRCPYQLFTPLFLFIVEYYSHVGMYPSLYINH